jgi:hypothetical protein
MKFDKDKQIQILKEASYPVDKSAKIKEKRKLLFGDVLTAQNFVFQLKRLSHLLTNTNVSPYQYPAKLVVLEGK